MMSSHPSKFLRRTLIADACLTGVTAVLLVLAAGLLAGPLGLPPSFLRGVGLSLVPFTALLVYLLRRNDLPRAAVWFVIACNALWAIDSVLLLFTDWIDPTAFGQAFVAVQAVVVAIFAETQCVALRRSTAMLA